MKLVKSLLLGSAAGLAAVAGAQAADLPVRKAAPVEYVRVCSAYGVGFFYIPGTDTCLRVSGRARFEYNVDLGPSVLAVADRLPVDRPHQPRRPHADRLRHPARVRPLRDRSPYRPFLLRHRTAPGQRRAGDRFRLLRPGAAPDRSRQGVHPVRRLTAGRATSFFDFYANDLELLRHRRRLGPGPTNLLAYTASFGSGWSATLSLEDPVERRYPIVTNLGGAALVNGATLFAAAEAAVQIFNPITGLPINSAFVGQRQRNAMPDIVAAVRVDQPWGSAQLSGIIHQIPTIGAAIPAGNTFAGATFTGFRADTEYGYGIQGGVKINLPMIAPGDLLYLQAVYARGLPRLVVGGALGARRRHRAPGRLPAERTVASCFNTADGIINPLNNEVSVDTGVGCGRGLPALLDPATAFGLPACL